MSEGFFLMLFLAKGAGICLFDTYFVQKVIWAIFLRERSFTSSMRPKQRDKEGETYQLDPLEFGHDRL